MGASWEELADQARDQNWSHEEYLAALLQRQVADRESKGTVMRVRTAHFPQVKTLEDFNLDHLPSLSPPPTARAAFYVRSGRSVSRSSRHPPTRHNAWRVRPETPSDPQSLW
ncbi:ATP-binding protein [Micromonospora sp. NPDC050795]|uniref:ATP-binding protein n=1 Tax=Micromonospora sp. NPDC050795 TaxID=3364282 RepID=UPI0037A1F5E3